MPDVSGQEIHRTQNPLPRWLRTIRVPESCDKMPEVKPVRRIRSVPGEEEPRTSPDDPVARLSAAFKHAGRGDEAAFSEIYDALSGLVYGVVLKVLRDPSMSEEVTQEVFVELWRLAPRFDAERGSPRAWAATIAHRRAVDRVRSEDARRRRDERELVVIDEPTDVVVDAVTTELDRQRLRAALATLTETQREALTLAYYGGHTYRAVAVLLDVPEGTIKTRVRDGLIRLRDQLGVMS